jgi:hypothetical protein
MGSGKTEGTFWEETPEVLDTVDSSDLLTQLYNPQVNAGSWWLYVKPLNKYYELEPGGYRTLSLVDKRYIDDLIRSEESANKGVACQESNVPLGNSNPTTAITCVATYRNPDNLQQVDTSSITNCFIKLTSGKYLAYEQITKPLGVSVNTCDILTQMGIQGVYVNGS